VDSAGNLSAVATLQPYPFETVVFYDTICPANAYTKHGFDIPASELQTAGLYERQYDIQNTTGGCDTVMMLKLTVKPAYDIVIEDITCKNNRYNRYGFTISADSLQEKGTFLYHDTLVTVFGCDSLVTLSLTVASQDTSHIPASICSGETYTQNGFNENKTGIYYNMLQNVYGCDSLVELDLTVNPVPDIEILALSDNFCEDDFAMLEVITNGDSFLWNTGSAENPINITQSGIYTATAFLGNCKDTASYTIEECPCIIYIPTAFTPNGDGLNDIFKPVIHNGEYRIKTYEMTIYDRWGNLIFSTQDHQTGWDGNDTAGRPYAQGVYNCRIRLTDKTGKETIRQTGVTLVR
jgi:gliding motility-associated-like protein